MLKSDNCCFILDGRPFYMFSGEIHYFRLMPDMWETHLKKAIDAGLNTVSTYVPWSWHEYEEGVFDFEGRTDPRRNLTAYLEAVKESGLKLCARIGPFSNAELKGEGLPSWLIENYPQIYSTGEGIENLPHTVLVSYANTVFRNFIEKWYDMVMPAILPYHVSNGGNIVLVQLCNEIGMIQWVNHRADYSLAADEMYRKYLKNKYGNIEALSKNYQGSSFSSFDEIEQPAARESYGWQDLWDWADFYRHYFADYYSFLYRSATARGLAGPVSANIPQFIDFDTRGRGLASPMTTSFYRHIPDSVPGVVFGGAYQMRRLDYENFHDIWIATQVVKALTGYRYPVICAELQSGIMRDRPRLYAPDVELNLKTSAAAGVDGLNCYMFSGGENPDNMGMFGKNHAWQAPVSPEGRTDDKYDAIRRFGDLIKTFGSQLAAAKPVMQLYHGIYPPYYGTEFLDPELCGSLTGKRDRLFFDGIARFLSLAGIGAGVVDLFMESELSPDKYRALAVFALSFMDVRTQKKLVKYVEDGGRLFIYPRLPRRDMSDRSCTIISEAFGIEKIGKVSTSTVSFGEDECFVEGKAETVDLSGDFTRIASVKGKICALSRKIGQGRAVFMGLNIPDYYDYQTSIITRMLKDELGIKKSITTDPGDITGFVRSGKKGSFIFLMNYHQRSYNNVRAEVFLPCAAKEIVLENIYMSPRSGRILPVNVRMDEDTEIVSSTVEILSYTRIDDGIRLRVSGNSGEKAEIILGLHGRSLEKRIELEKNIEEVDITE